MGGNKIQPLPNERARRNMKQLTLEDIVLWEAQAEKLHWFKRWDKVFNDSTWFAGGTINASYTCLDAHINAGRGDHVAIIWEDELGNKKRISYQKLYDMNNQIAYNLRKLGVKKGDHVVVYLPMIPEAVATMLAIARLGAIHVVVFSGFGAEALRNRVIDVGAKIIITTDFDIRRGKRIALREIVDRAVLQDLNIQVIDVGILNVGTPLESSEKTYVIPEAVESSHPLFILYTSGSTGKPKGIAHSTGGYLTYVHSTIKWAFNINKESIYWCTADIGWVTGHSYGVYGPLTHGATIVMYDGAPDAPSQDIWWKLIERYKITIFYTAPTALRFFMKLGDTLIKKHDLSSLQVLGSVGEPLNPHVWNWYNEVIGGGRCPIIDTWWQTETGGFMLAPTGQVQQVPKPGSVAKPLPGIEMDIIDERGESVDADTKGFLVVKKPWPGMHLGMGLTGMYRCGDYAIKDAQGDHWILGRADEVLNIAGHRVGTAEIESAMLSHTAIAESAAIGVIDEIKGEGVVVFVVLRNVENDSLNTSKTSPLSQKALDSTSLERELLACVHAHIGKFATPSGIHTIAKMPKTRSGKIMRRVLKAMVQETPLGDLSTMEDVDVIEEILKVYRDFLATKHTKM